MKVLVAFYSRDSHTREVARKVAEALNAEIDEIIDKKNRKGIIGFLIAGYEATRGKTTQISFEKDPSDYDLVILGGPTWNSRVTPAIRTYLLQNRGKIKEAVFFTTCAGSSKKCLAQMEELYGKKALFKKVIVNKKLDEETEEFIKELKDLIGSNL
ncbi:flavodoxin family protein [Pyrococcus woesei]|uniref:flavodoxin family protein n=1 Tax=Pyrococcus woesei TaxID=2262 RepID=UPI003D2F1519